MRNHPLINKFEEAQLVPNLPEFRVGDSVTVQVRVREGERERLQSFAGLVIAKRNRGLNSSFTVRRISNGVGVERSFQLHSRLISSIEVTRRGKVRQGKLYYMRARSGKASRIKERLEKSAGTKATQQPPQTTAEPEALKAAKPQAVELQPAATEESKATTTKAAAVTKDEAAESPAAPAAKTA